MSGFRIPDNDVAAFPLQSQIFELDIEIMAGDAGWVVAGCEVTAQGSPDMSVHVAAGVARPRGLPNVLVAADDLAIDAAHATLWRIDLVSASDAGVLTYTAGVEAIASAVKPPARPADHVGLAFVCVPPTATSISGDLIIDKRNLSDPGVLRYLDRGNTGSTETIDFSAADVQRIVLNAATVTLSTSGWPAAGIPGIVRVYVEQDGTGGRLLDYSGEIDWGDPGPPILQTTPGAVDIIDLQTIDGGTNVLASMPNRPGATGSAGADGADGISGGAVSIPYTFSTTTTDADPGNGQLRLSNATQNASTVIRADLLASDGTDWSAVLATLADADNVVKGHLRLFKTSDPTKWLLFTVSAVASPSGYKNITVANVGSSAASPFSDADAITLDFTRSGDQGDAGTASVGTDGIWDAAGDLVQGTGANTAAKLTLGAAGTVVRSTGSTNAYAFPPGYEFSYAENTSSVTVSATSEATADTCVTAGAVSFDGSTTVLVEFFAVALIPGNTDQADNISVWLYDGASSIGQIAFVRSITTNQANDRPCYVAHRLTPSNASHTYSIRASRGGHNGTVYAGAGGNGAVMPMFIRITKV